MTTPHRQRARRQQGFVAWLAIVALWLTIVAPVVSQTVADPLDSLISIGACGVHHADGTQTPPSGHPLEKCGYCGMLAGHSLLPDATLPSLAASMLAGLTLPAPVVASGSDDRILAAEPRGPPGFAHA